MQNQTRNKHVYFVILAGGQGERLWPLSRHALPKQLLAIGNNKTLIQQAIDRVLPLAYSRDNIWISTTKDHEHTIRTHVGNDVGTILVEPTSRNTGAAILYCCYQLQQHDPNAIALFLPADAFIPEQDNELFQTSMQQMICAAATQEIIVLAGVKPTYPASEYGYIEYNAHDTQTTLHKIIHFHEKPSPAIAHYYLQIETMLWNLGIFGAQVNIFINTSKITSPALYTSIDAYMNGTACYETVPNISIDCAVIEQAHNVWVLPAQFTWSDAGNIDVFLKLQKQYGEQKTECIEIESENNLIQVPNTFVAIIGVSDICIVQTGNVLLITKRDKTNLVKNIVHHLKKEGQQEYL